jgi:hypothetical protein
MLSFNPYLLIILTLHMSSHLWWVRAHYSPQLVELWSFVSSLLWYITPHMRRTGSPGGGLQRGVRAYLGAVSQSTLWRQGIILMLGTCSQMLWVKNRATQMLMVKGPSSFEALFPLGYNDLQTKVMKDIPSWSRYMLMKEEAYEISETTQIIISHY